MLEFFANWNPDAILGLVSIVGGLLAVAICVGLISWCVVRRAQIAADQLGTKVLASLRDRRGPLGPAARASRTALVPALPPEGRGDEAAGT